MNPQNQQSNTPEPQQPTVIAPELMFQPKAMDMHIASLPDPIAPKKRLNKRRLIIALIVVLLIAAVAVAMLHGNKDDTATTQSSGNKSSSSNSPDASTQTNGTSNSPSQTVDGTAASAGAAAASTQAVKDQAQASGNKIAMYLDAYLIDNESYPAEINPAYFADYSPDVGVFTPPAGTRYVYTPTPAGCTTMNYDCTSYTLTTVDAVSGAVLATAEQSEDE